jgi:FKBP-type peptidyl-prolyl cis-trans isomerase
MMKNFTVTLITVTIITCWGCASKPIQRVDTVETLTDQTELAKIAVSKKDLNVRINAVKKITDQNELANIAISESDSRVREEAVKRLDDQNVLAKIAVSKMTMHKLRSEAMRRITDQGILANIAISGGDLDIRKMAIRNLDDQPLLINLTKEGNDPSIRLVALSRTEDIPTINKYAAPIQKELGAMNKYAAVARLRLAIRESPIERRFGKIQLDVDLRTTNQRYEELVGGKSSYVDGERFIVRIQKDGNILAESSTETQFPSNISIARSGADPKFGTPSIDIGALLSQLFKFPVLTRDDFVELTRSSIPEIRKAAEVKLREHSENAHDNIKKIDRERSSVKEEAAAWPNAITTSSGLQYVILQEGTGNETPAEGAIVKVHFTGKLLDGTKFDSSYERGRGEPIEFVVGYGQVIKGWDEAFLTMKRGEKRVLIIPANLGYGSSGKGKVRPNATMIFDVELVDFLPL